MKTQFIILIFCLMMSHAAMAQTSDSPVKVQVESELIIKAYKPLTTLYLNTDNAVKITAQGHPNLRPEVKDGKITQPEKDGVFVVNPDKLGKLTIKIFDSNDVGKKAEPLAIYQYEVIKLPDMEPTISGKNSGNITKKEFLADSMLHVGNGDMFAPNYYEILGFKVSVSMPGKDPILDIPCNGNKITTRIRNLIRAADPGTKIEIDQIRGIGYNQKLGGEVVETMDNYEMHVQSMSFVLAE